jgi:hypothetical protein
VDFKLISVKQIWNSAPHNAMTDLIHWQDRWWCTFRESDQHQNSLNGVIRVIYSSDLSLWQSALLIREEGFDLRDPKFSLNPQEELLLHYQGVKLDQGKYVIWQPRLVRSKEGKRWSDPLICFEPHEWPWRITWFEGRAYAVSYRLSSFVKRSQPWIVHLCVSEDAIHYQRLCTWPIAYYPSEATIRFRPDGEMVIYIRRREKEQMEWNDPNWVGTSQKPYDRWVWHATDRHLGGPNFLILEGGEMCAAGRILWPSPYGLMAKTVVGELTLEHFTPKWVLPSGGDCSYPGMVLEGNTLYVSYYSTEGGRTSVYLALLKKG